MDRISPPRRRPRRRLLPVLLLTRAYGVIGVWAMMTAELVARGLLCFWRLYRGRWLSMSKINF